MTPIARTALLASIAHYERNVAHVDANRIDLVSVNGRDCALCARFYGSNNCAGCPVFEHTKWRHCQGTPWSDAMDALEDFNDGCGDAAIVRDALVRELEFLRSLLEE